MWRTMDSALEKSNMSEVRSSMRINFMDTAFRESPGFSKYFIDTAYRRKAFDLLWPVFQRRNCKCVEVRQIINKIANLMLRFCAINYSTGGTKGCEVNGNLKRELLGIRFNHKWSFGEIVRYCLTKCGQNVNMKLFKSS